MLRHVVPCSHFGKMCYLSSPLSSILPLYSTHTSNWKSRRVDSRDIDALRNTLFWTTFVKYTDDIWPTAMARHYSDSHFPIRGINIHNHNTTQEQLLNSSILNSQRRTRDESLKDGLYFFCQMVKTNTKIQYLSTFRLCSAFFRTQNATKAWCCGTSLSHFW